MTADVDADDGRLDDARRALAEEYHRRAVSFGRLLARTRRFLDREDVEGACLLALCRAALKWDAGLGEFEPYFQAWCRGAVRDLCLARRPKGYRKGRVGTLEAVPGVEPLGFDHPGGADPAYGVVLRDEVDVLLGGLPARERDALWLRHGEGLTLREAGARLGVSYESVRLAEAAALRRLRAPAGVAA